MEQLKSIVSHFIPDTKINSIEPYGNGHINTTYLVETDDGSYILQQINTKIFKDVDGLMNNIILVADHIREKTQESGKDIAKATLFYLNADNGKPYVLTDGGAYRVAKFIDDTFTIEIMENEEHFYKAGLAFGKFARMLSDFDASKLVETIKNFHNTASRYKDFEKAVRDDVKNRASDVSDEIAFVRKRKSFMNLFVRKLENGKIPLRVTHNDTKLNNILFDKSTEKPVAVIDLDTVMPGSILFDFGDAIRSGATHAAEDERDLSKVDFDLNLYRAFARGYLEKCNRALTVSEIEMLPYSSIMLTLECGMRFLTDHLNGDTYFKIHRENHNLDRARTQFKLVKEMENHIDDLIDIINELAY